MFSLFLASLCEGEMLGRCSLCARALYVETLYFQANCLAVKILLVFRNPPLCCFPSVRD